MFSSLTLISSPIVSKEYKNRPKGLSVKNLSLGYDQALTSPLEFFLPMGQSLSLMGPNGGGKSTLLKTLGGVLRPLKGSFSLLYENHHEENIEKSSSSFFDSLPFFTSNKKPLMAYFPQQFTGIANFPLRVRDVVAMGQGLSIKGFFQKNTPYNHSIEQLDHILDLFSLKILELSPVGTLSPGQFQRVLLARFYLYIVHYSCPLILMDEPFSSVDETTSRNLLNIFLDLLPKGHMLILSHHNTPRALDFFSTTLLLSRHFHLFGESSHVLQEKYWTEAHKHPPHFCC